MPCLLCIALVNAALFAQAPRPAPANTADQPAQFEALQKALQDPSARQKLDMWAALDPLARQKLERLTKELNARKAALLGSKTAFRMEPRLPVTRTCSSPLPTFVPPDRDTQIAVEPRRVGTVREVQLPAPPCDDVKQVK